MFYKEIEVSGQTRGTLPPPPKKAPGHPKRVSRKNYGADRDEKQGKTELLQFDLYLFPQPDIFGGSAEQELYFPRLDNELMRFFRPVR